MWELKVPETFKTLVNDIKELEDSFGTFLHTRIKYNPVSIITIKDVIDSFLGDGPCPEPNSKVYRLYLKKITDYIKETNTINAYDNCILFLIYQL